MNKVLLIVFLFSSAIVFGQGAASPDLAWDSDPGTSGIQKDFWFEMETDSDGSSWVSKGTESKAIEFNKTPNGYVESASLLSSHDQLTYDLGWFNLWFFTGYTYDFNFTYFGYEEWYVIKVPSTGNLTLSLDVSGNTSDEKDATTFQWYEFDLSPSEIGIEEFPDDFDTGIRDYREYTIDGNIMTFELSTSFSAGLQNITKEYVLIRIGNNSALDTDDFISSYKLSVSSTNNKCQNALLFPISTTPFSDTSNTSIKDSLNSNSEITSPFYTSNVNSSVVGDDDITFGGGSPGTWYKVMDMQAPLYFATCGTNYDTQMLLFRDECPASQTSSGMIIGAEDQNFNLDPGSSERLVCIDDPNNYDLPVMYIDDPVGDFAANSIYVYLFGVTLADMGLFDLYIMNQLGGILPVDWLDFKGRAGVNGNTLYWATASETQNDHFLLEKSADGEYFSALATIPGAGNSAFENHYEYLDKNPLPITYYRISQFDWDGSQDFGPTIVVENESKWANYSILENPVTSGVLKIKAQTVKRENMIHLNLIDMHGQIVFQQDVDLSGDEQIIAVNTTGMTNGIYLLSIYDNYSQFNDKIIIQSTK